MGIYTLSGVFNCEKFKLIIMKFNFENLNEDIRKLMLDEFSLDESNENIYLSKRFNENGHTLYNQLFENYIKNGDEVTLKDSLELNNCFKSHEERLGKNGIMLVRFQ